MPRRFPIVQFPNPPLIAAMLFAAAARTGHGDNARAARIASAAALVVWAVQEIVWGANWFRRLLGTGVGAHALTSLGRLVGDGNSGDHSRRRMR